MRGLVPRLGRGAWVVLAADPLSAVGVLALRLARWLPAGADQAQAAGAVAKLAGMTEGP